MAIGSTRWLSVVAAATLLLGLLLSTAVLTRGATSEQPAKKHSHHMSPDQSRASLVSPLIMLAEYHAHDATCPVDDLLQFALLNQEVEPGTEDAYGVPQLVMVNMVAKPRGMNDHSAIVEYQGEPGFMKCSHKLDWYWREVDSLSDISMFNPSETRIATLPGWLGTLTINDTMNRLLTYFRTADGFGCVIVSLVEDGLTLHEYVRHVNKTGGDKSAAMMRVARQLLLGVAHIHRVDWAHGDLKPDNVMVKLAPTRSSPDNIRVVVIDFNLAIPADELKIPAGRTAGYTPPEVALRNPIDMKRYDSWSVGATLFSAFHRRIPYDADFTSTGHKIRWSPQRRRNNMRRLMANNRHTHAPMNCSEELAAVISTLMTINVAERPLPEEMLHSLVATTSHH